MGGTSQMEGSINAKALRQEWEYEPLERAGGSLTAVEWALRGRKVTDDVWEAIGRDQVHLTSFYESKQTLNIK